MTRTLYSASVIFLSVFILWNVSYINTTQKNNADTSFKRVEQKKSDTQHVNTFSNEWQMVEARIDELNKDNSSSEHFLANIDQDSSMVELYIAALLKFSNGQAQQSYQLVSAIEINKIPGDYLYFPYRLYQLVNSDSINPYLNALLNAKNKQILTPLIKARALGFNGQLVESLETYLETNPEYWKNIDLELFKQMIIFDGLKTDTQRLLYAAWKSGKLDNDMAIMIRQIAVNSDKNNKQGLQQFKQRIIDKPVLLQVAKKSIIKMSQARKLFLDNDYDALLQTYDGAEPNLLSTEIVTLLFLSAAKNEQLTEAYKWGQEITRRHNDQTVREWVSRISREIS